MKRRPRPQLIALCALALCACEALFIENPQNCVLREGSCAESERCNQETRRCETLDCTKNTALCGPSEACGATTHRCELRTFVLGQPDAAQNRNAAYGQTRPWTALLVRDPATSGKTRLVVTDSGNARVLIWNDVPTQNRPADAVLGMPDVNTLSVSGSYDGVSETSMTQPWGATSDGTNLVVGDYPLSRLLIYDRIPTQSGQSALTAATGLWGQPGFLSSQPNGGSAMVNALGGNNMRGFFGAPPSREFYIVDYGNHRVLIFDSLPTSATQLPSGVLGQPDFTTNTPLAGTDGLNYPRSFTNDATRLYVADSANSRVLIYPLSPRSATASAVIGQADFTATAPNRGGATAANTLNVPSGLAMVDDAGTPRLFVADTYNHRVLRFSNGAPDADLVLGQSDFTSSQQNRGGAVAANTLYYPTDVSSDGTHLTISDFYNHRVLIWNRLPQGNGAPADVVLGQPSADTALSNAPPVRSGLQFDTPTQVVSDGTRLAVVDSSNHRVLLYKQLPQQGDVLPDVVLGQADFVGAKPNSGLSAPTAATLSEPSGVALDNGRVVIVDPGNYRVLIWNVFPTQNFAPADVVLGQSDFTTGTPQPPATGLSPAGVFLDQGVLYVADGGNNRVLLFKDLSRSGAAADRVLGQPDLDQITANNGGQKAYSLAQPYAVSVASGRLFVADSGNHRVLSFTLPIAANRQAADVVIGQQNAETSYTRPDRSRLDSPDGLLIHNGRLFVASSRQNRVLYWNQLPTANGQRADGVLGQPDFLSTLPNHPDLPAIERLSAPAGLAATGAYLWIADLLNHRVVARALPR